ncbi:conjugal transfer protein TraH [Agrobacterium tumefaciens]|uniref:TraH family protein n=1 Tax=Agrobacterium tumefaciens TaxID=358 RepID=UPI0015718210|nr:TraH family protein [Agrobacterium tumefaciens]MCZ7497263.1 TraH family protein [Rhizobium rhizogenes]NTE56480.1 conjugal transfer protein TraH [Agrobacterium tumefaciens]NTE74448.1 conjugal transfer protein TraH [Agrobacterium tumefaciens]
MLDIALIEKCADPSLTPAIVEQFVEAAGSRDPLAVTVKSGGRLILVPKPKTPVEALEIVRENAGQAVVRVGLTQFPAGVGVKDVSELKADLVDSCENLRMGTTMFAKVMRIVAKWYGNPTNKDVLPYIFDDAVYSWRTGEFEGVEVFQAEDPVKGWAIPKTTVAVQDDGDQRSIASETRPEEQHDDVAEDEHPHEAGAEKAGMRIDMSRVGGQK